MNMREAMGRVDRDYPAPGSGIVRRRAFEADIEVDEALILQMDQSPVCDLQVRGGEFEVEDRE